MFRYAVLLSCWCYSWNVAPTPQLWIQHFKVRRIPCIAYYLNKNYNSSVFLTTILLIVYICLNMQFCWCTSWEWSTNSTTEDSAFKVKLIPGIADYLNISHNSSVFSNYYFITFGYICLDMQSCCPAGVPHKSEAPTPQLWIQHLRWGSYLV